MAKPILHRFSEELKPNLKLSSYVYDLNITNQDSTYKGSAIITNSGKGKLEINRINTGCGCTNAEISKNILAPKDTTLLKFTYDPKGKMGYQEEYIIIEANTDSLVHLLKVTAFIDDLKGYLFTY